jgi:hypothetical protein
LYDYTKAVDLLTILNDKSKLEKQVRELNEKSKDNDHLLKAKLQEKDEQIQTLIKNQERFETLIQSLIDSGQLRAATGSSS